MDTSLNRHALSGNRGFRQLVGEVVRRIVPGILLGLVIVDPAPALAQSLKDRFWAEYPVASQKLAEAVSDLDLMAKAREIRAGQDTGWKSIRVLANGENLRLHMIPPGRTETPGNEEKAYLLTPSVCAKVVDPNTPAVWVEYQGTSPTPALELESTVNFLRYVKALYCTDANTFLGEINEKRYVVTEISADPDKETWVRVSYDFMDDRHGPKFKATGFGYFVLNPSEGWALRRHVHFTGQPYSVSMDTAVVPRLTPSGAYIVDQYKSSVFSARQTGPRAFSAGELRESLEYKVDSIGSGQVGTDAFTLRALGVGHDTLP